MGLGRRSRLLLLRCSRNDTGGADCFRSFYIAGATFCSLEIQLFYRIPDRVTRIQPLGMCLSGCGITMDEAYLGDCRTNMQEAEDNYR